MVSRWERREPESNEIDVEARPLGDRGASGDDDWTAATARSITAARRAAHAMRVVACLIPALSGLGYVLTSFWVDDGSMTGMSMRLRIGSLLGFVWAPLAIGALVYAISVLLTLYAARIELDARSRGPGGS